MMKRDCLLIIGCVLLLQSLLLSTPLCADEVDHLYAKAAEKYKALYNDPAYRKSEENWLTTIKQFKLIYKTYPRHYQAPKALFSIGKLYRSLYRLNQKDIYLDRSSISFRTLVRQYPLNGLSDDAQYALGENYEVYKQDVDLAQIEYRKVLELFPNGSAVKKTKEKLEQFKNAQDVTVAPEMEIATAPTDLAKPQFGGLSEEESNNNSSILVSKVDYWSTIEWTRMVINTKGQVRYKYHLLAEDKQHPQKRLYIDLHNSYIPADFKRRIAVNDGLISQARIAQFDKSTVRIVLDIQSLDRIKVFHFSLPNQYKIVIDVIGKPSLPPVKQVEPEQEVAGTKPKSKEKIQQELSLSKALGLKVNTIIIDPGHGGKDPGAIAFNLMEKDVVLAISKHLKKLIDRNHPQVRTLLTRSTDVFIELEARTAFANKHRGDLFISIHANASLKKHVSGVETYFLNLTTDEDALTLAAKENQTSLKSISDLQTILNDLMVNSKIKESRDLAEVIQSSMVDVTGRSNHKMKDLGVKQAPFTVLIGAQMPSVLVETGFISNAKENKVLRNETYKKVIANGIYQGIKQYID